LRRPLLRHAARQ